MVFYYKKLLQLRDLYVADFKIARLNRARYVELPVSMISLNKSRPKCLEVLTICSNLATIHRNVWHP